MATTTETSAMFSLAMLTKEAAAVPAEPEEAPRKSLREAVFAPALATPVAVEEAPSRVRGWVFVAAFVAMIAPVVGVVAVHETRTPAPKHATTATTTTTTTATTTAAAIVETSEKTDSTPTASATQASPPAPCMCMPPPRPKPIATATATATAPVKHEAPKCCAGETEMQCAMRRSVGATCG